jgi:capsular polysaccharide export protein
MTILITGASGFIGSYLARRLIKAGQRPRLLVRNSVLLDDTVRQGAEIIVGDLANHEALKVAVQGVSVVYHCAANVHTWDSLDAYTATNVRGTQNLLDAIAQYCPELKRLVHLSTVDVYGFPTEPCDEQTSLPISKFGYGESKRLAEERIQAWGKAQSIPYTILRPCNVIGIGSPFIKRITDMLQHGVMLSIDQGRVHGGFVYVEHVLDYMCWAATADIAAFQCYNVRDAYDASWAEFLSGVRARLSRRGLVINLPYLAAKIVARLCKGLYGLFDKAREPLLHPLIIDIFGRTCGHSAAKIYRDSGIKHETTFYEVLDRCFLKDARHFVFLQGMPCGFFKALARALTADGARTTGISLCAGDRWFQAGATRKHYRGSFNAWPDFINQFFLQERVTDLVLLGEQRRYHREAIIAAKALNIRVTVTDFGYLRPDWITWERDGMSGNSRFPKDAESIRALAAQCPPVNWTRQYQDSFARMAIGDLVFSFTNVFFWWLYPYYKSTILRPHPLIYFPLMGVRLLTEKTRHAIALKKFDAYRQRRRSYFLFPMQLEHDFQMAAYSPFASVEDVLHHVFASFSAHAPVNTDLVCKCHPLDPGLRRWSVRIQKLARHYKIEDRVCYIDGCYLSAMIPDAAGMVTVNSTSGVEALQAGCPTLVLGQAVYDIQGLTDQNGIDHFWHNPTPPDKTLTEAFMQAIAGTIQIRGVYFSARGMQAAVDAVRERLNSLPPPSRG